MAKVIIDKTAAQGIYSRRKNNCQKILVVKQTFTRKTSACALYDN